MKHIASILSILALAGTVMPSVFYLAGQTTLPTVKTIIKMPTRPRYSSMKVKRLRKLPAES